MSISERNKKNVQVAIYNRFYEQLLMEQLLCQMKAKKGVRKKPLNDNISILTDFKSCSFPNY